MRMLATSLTWGLQNFWDPQSKSEFHYNRVESCWNSSWWYGEPVRIGELP